MGVTDADGKKLQPEDGMTILVYIQLGDDWKEADEIKAVFLSEGMDEILFTETIENYELPDGSRSNVAVIELKHFSDYAIFEVSDNDNISNNMSNDTNDLTNTMSSSYISKTTDPIIPQTIIVLAAFMMLALAGLWGSLKTKRT